MEGFRGPSEGLRGGGPQRDSGAQTRPRGVQGDGIVHILSAVMKLWDFVILLFYIFNFFDYFHGSVIRS